MNERRHFDRIPFGTTVYLRQERSEWVGALEDISMRGVLVRALLKGVDEQDLCELIIPLGDELILDFRGEIVHREGELVGFRFVEQDPATFSHLLRLLELNTGNPDRVERELAFLLDADQGKNAAS